MALMTQVKTLRFLREVLLGHGTRVLPYEPDRKPDPPGSGPAQRLPRSGPEAEGMSSAALAGLYRDLAAAKGACVHGLIVARHGRVVSEGWFAPFRPGVWHVTHSLCKSFTGTAVGLAVEEGFFGLDDKVSEYFPEYCTLLTGRRTRAITVRHLLTMCSGITFNEMGEALERDWVRAIFESEIAFEPGTKFVYNSMNSYLLSALVKKTTGQGLVEFLTPRIFEPLGFGPVGWEKCPCGIEKGGWGMYLDPEDMLKFGQLYLQGGVWRGPQGERRLIPESWAREAVRTQITGADGEYGWQIWTREEDGSFLMNGMFGQYVAVFPRQDIVVVLTSGNGNLLTDSVSYTRLRAALAEPHFSDGPLPADAAGEKELARVLAALEFDRPVPPAPPPQPWYRAAGARLRGLLRRPRRPQPAAAPGVLPPEALAFCGETWRFEKSRGGLMPMILQFMDGRFSGGVRALRIEPEGEALVLYWEEDGVTLRLPAGWKRWADGSVCVQGETFLTAARAEVKPDEDDQPVLKIEVCLPEHSSCRRLKLSWEEGGVLLRLDESPSLALAINKVSGQAANTGAKDPVSDLLLGGGYPQYRVRQLIAPRLRGVATHAGDPALAAEAQPAGREITERG